MMKEESMLSLSLLHRQGLLPQETLPGDKRSGKKSFNPKQVSVTSPCEYYSFLLVQNLVWLHNRPENFPCGSRHGTYFVCICLDQKSTTQRRVRAVSQHTGVGGAFLASRQGSVS